MKKKTIGVLSILIFIVIIGFFVTQRNTAIEVDAITITEGNIEKYVEELGVVMAKNQDSIYTIAAGRVTDVLVEVGDRVQKGDVLVKIDSNDITVQLTQLQIQRKAVDAQYNEAMKPIDGREIEKFELDIALLEAKIKQTERAVNNNEQLYKAGSISYEELHNSHILLDIERTNLEQMRLNLELIKKPISDNIKQQFVAQLQQIDLQIGELEKKTSNFIVTSPIDGTVMMKVVTKGSYLQPGMKILEIGNTQELYIESDVLVNDISDVAEGADVNISNKNLGIVQMKGKVSKIHPQAFSKISDLGIEQKRIKVEIDIKDAVVNLKPGYDLDIEIITDKKENVLLVPESAIFMIEGKRYVFIVENDRAQLRSIESGLESQRQVEVIEGLNRGDIVILSPNTKLEEGVNVKLR